MVTLRQVRLPAASTSNAARTAATDPQPRPLCLVRSRAQRNHGREPMSLDLLGELNWLAVIVAAVAFFALGAV
jgi:hypothetical protein